MMPFPTFRTLLIGFVALLSHVAATASPPLNGMAIHSELGQEQFIAALYSKTVSTDARSLIMADEDKAMEIRVLAETLFPRRLQRLWIEGIAINAGAAEMERHAQHLADFSNLLRIRLVAGDRLRIERLTAQNVTRIMLNDHTLDDLPNRQFFDLLVRVWLGPVPLSSAFKDSLLVGGAVDNTLNARYLATTPSAERSASIVAGMESGRIPRRQDTSSQDTPPQNTQPPATAETVADAQPPAQTDPALTAELPPTPSQPSAAPETQPEKSTEAAPAPVTLATADSLFQDDAFFEEEDSSFTAEKLLSEQIYIARLAKWTSNFVRYPRAALRSSQEGTVRVTVSLRRDGRVQDVQILERSEYEPLNRAAIQAVRSANPYPAVPDDISSDPFLFTVPVVFRLN